MTNRLDRFATEKAYSQPCQPALWETHERET